MNHEHVIHTYVNKKKKHKYDDLKLVAYEEFSTKILSSTKHTTFRSSQNV